MISNRHLPIVGSNYPMRPSPSREDKLDDSCTKKHYAAAETDVLSLTDNQFPDISISCVIFALPGKLDPSKNEGLLGRTKSP